MTRFVLLSKMNFSRMRAISHCLSPCITGQWNANYPSYLSIRLIWNSKTNVGCPIISTSNHMFDMAICDKFPSALLKILKLPE